MYIISNDEVISCSFLPQYNTLDHGGFRTSYDVNMDGTVLPTHGITKKSIHRNTNPRMLK